jgi:hypothetical protein
MRAISPPAEPPGLEQRIWKRLPATLLVGTLVPLGLSMINRVSTPVTWSAGGGESLLLLWDYTMIGVVIFHWTMVLTVALGCLIVKIMKGPTYAADAYPLPVERQRPTGLLP